MTLIPPLLYRRTEQALSHLNIFVAFLVIVLSTIAVAYVVAHSEQSPTLSDDVGALLPDNEWTLTDAISHFRRDKVIPLEKGGSLPFRTIWVRVDLKNHKVGANEVLTLKSIRPRDANVWAIKTEKNHPIAEPLGWEATRSGMSIALPSANSSGLEIFAQIEPDSINRIQLSIASKSDAIAQNFKFERTGGLLVGALLMVAFFSIVVAIFNRDPIFFLYAAWLLTTLRVAAYNGDWDAAQRLTKQSNRSSQSMKTILCPVWHELQEFTPDSLSKLSAIEDINDLLDCQFQ
jgi:hypothetical protein